MKKVLFLDNCNGHFHANPLADLVELPETVDLNVVKQSERKQLSAFRTGGSWKQALEDLKINYNLLKTGKLDDFKGELYEQYEVISGNY